MASLHQPLWALSFEEVYASLGTAADGLSQIEAQSRLEKFGANELPEPAHRPLWLRFADQLTHFMALPIAKGELRIILAAMPLVKSKSSDCGTTLIH